MREFVVRIKCLIHKCPVIPAGEQLVWLPGEGRGEFILDQADLYCTAWGGDINKDGQHDFTIEAGWEDKP